MNSPTLQFLVAGALIAAWAWMLGRPILTNLFRRSRRDSVGHFRYQQAVLGRPLDEDPFSRRSVSKTVLQPLRDWRGQPLERRRLQIMLGFSFATFFSLLMAIALRGSAIRLFLIMIVCFAAYLAYAAYVGAAQIRRQQHAVGRTRRKSQQAAGQYTSDELTSDGYPGEEYAQERDIVERRSAVEAGFSADADLDDGVRLTGHQVIDHSSTYDDVIHNTPTRNAPIHGAPTRRTAVEEELPLVAETDDPFDGSEGFGTGDFEDGFFEPIPELQFAPLNLDASLIKPTEPIFDEQPDEIEDRSIAAETIDSTPAESDDVEMPDAMVDAFDEADTAAEIEEDQKPTEQQRDTTPAFTTPPKQRQRQVRKKARPIYIESQLDEADDEQRVVND